VKKGVKLKTLIETQMRNTAGFVGVKRRIALRIHLSWRASAGAQWA
jgi:hypothetical protein